MGSSGNKLVLDALVQINLVDTKMKKDFEMGTSDTDPFEFFYEKRKIFIMKKILCVILVFLCPELLFAEVLPELPESLASPFVDVKNVEILKSATELELFFDKTGYTLEQVHKDHKIPQLYVTNLPSDLNKLPVHQKTALFIRLLLTSVVKVTNDILAVRNELDLIAKKDSTGIELTAEERQWLASVATDYHGEPDNIQDLQDRIDILPVGLIMAQAIDESGWGTSHFAITGNALYGQHLGKGSKGTFLTTPGGHVRVASFDNLYHSTASYIHNLNTTKAYKNLRDDRAEIKLRHGELTGEHLAGALLQYSERGQHYVDTLRWLIKHYKLDKLNSVIFDASVTSTLIKLKK